MKFRSVGTSGRDLGHICNVGLAVLVTPLLPGCLPKYVDLQFQQNLGSVVLMRQETMYQFWLVLAVL